MYTAEGATAESSYFTVVLADDKCKVLTSEYLSVSEACLLEKSGDAANFVALFANKEALAQLEKNYKDYGFEIKDAALIAAFNAAAVLATEEADAKVFKALREVFAIKEAVADKPKDEVPADTKKEGEPEVPVVAEGDKVEEPKEGE
jgi:hypothetical protein